MSDVIKHLELIHLVVSRLATNSFAFKGWAVTVLAAALALAGQGQGSDRMNPNIMLVGLLPALGFWWLDAQCLRRERLFRCLYDEVRTRSETDFSMRVDGFAKHIGSTWSVAISPGLAGFYGSLALVAIALRVLRQMGWL